MCVYGELSESPCSVLTFNENICSQGYPFCDMLKGFHVRMFEIEAPETLAEVYGRASGYIEALYDSEMVEGWRASDLLETTMRAYRSACARMS